MNDVLAPAEDTQLRASALNALGILSRLEETSPDRTGKRKQWITALMHLARPRGASSEADPADPQVLEEVLTFLETLQGSSADPALVAVPDTDRQGEDVEDHAAEPAAASPEQVQAPAQARTQGQEQEDESPFREDPALPSLRAEDTSQEMPPEWALDAWDAAPPREEYTQEEIDYVRTLQQQIHERELARIQAHTPYLPMPRGNEQQLEPYPEDVPPPAVWRQEGQQAAAPVPWATGDVHPPASMPSATGNAQQPFVSAERVESASTPAAAPGTETYRQWQGLFSTLSRSLVLLAGCAFAALAFASNAALLPILGVAIMVGGALTHAWAIMVQPQDGGPSGRRRGERVSWLRALRMCTLAVPVLTLILSSVTLTLIGSVLLPQRRAEHVHSYAREALQIAQRLALHR
ncbi:hypothetical protein [Streptomyces plumbiresistens]|uniref:RDD domain-containing protein n=1 Tax=Streptomyces plumbiresistens TaxID=511811 RepID=A0ABP7Q9J2_9ACTN